MNQAMHIFKKDCRRFWPLLLALGAALAMLFWRAIDLPSIESDHPEPRLLSTFYLLFDAFVLVFAALLILEDRLVGTRAFWKTRPIDRGRLLLAKSAFALLFFILVPLTVQGLALLTLDADSGEILSAALSALSTLAPRLVLTMWLAAVSRDFPRFAVPAIVSLLLIVLLPNVVARLFSHRIFSSDQFGFILQVWLALIAFAAGLAMIHHYRTCDTRKSVLLLIGGGIAVSATLALGPTERLYWAAQAAVLGTSDDGLRLQVVKQPGADKIEYRRSDEARVQLFVPVQPVFRPSFSASCLMTQNQLRVSGRVLNDVRRCGWTLSHDEGTTVDLVDVAEIPVDTYDRLSDRAVQVESRILMRSIREVELAELPLLQGRRFRDGPLQVHLETVEVEARKLSLKFAGRGLSMAKSLAPLRRFPWDAKPRILHPTHPMPAADERQLSIKERRRVVLPGCLLITFSGRYEGSLDKSSLWTLDAAWMGKARFALMSPVDQGTFWEKLETREAQLKNLTSESWQRRLLPGITE